MIRRGVLVFLRVTQPWYAFIEKAYVIGEKLMMWPSNTQHCQKKSFSREFIRNFYNVLAG